jgi:beta-N-acetylhexosaminidase
MPKSFGPLIIDVAGTALQPEERDLLQHPFVGGVVLFARNYETPQQLQSLITEIRQVKAKPLLIMIDQEGGRVQRCRHQFTRLPPAGDYSHLAKNNPLLAQQLSEAGGWLMAAELLTRGVDLSLAPVLDLNKGVSSVIGDRAFGATATQTIALAAAFIEGMKKAGMAATGKHFPGHGSVASDSHQELPVDERSFEHIEKEDLQPFIHFINAKIPALMTAHILFPAVDSLPVSFSRYWLHNILRERLGFKGVVMSDDLDMKGAATVGDYADRMQAAAAAGCDLILLCNNRAAVLQILDKVPYAAYLLDLKKYELLRGNFAAFQQPLEQNAHWQNYRDSLLKHGERELL